METRTIIAIVVVLALVAGAAYYFGGSSRGEEKIDGAAVLLSAVRKSANLTSYVIDRQTVRGDATPINSSVLVLGEKKRVDMWDGIGVRRTFYFLPEGTFVCLENAGACLKVDETSGQYYRQLVNSLYVAGQIDVSDVGKIARWVDTGVIESFGSIYETTVAGRQCQLIEYNLRYDKMSDSDLAAAGWDRRTALAVSEVVKDCVDRETGIGLYHEANGTVLGESTVTTFNATYFNPRPVAPESAFALRGEIVNESAFAGIEGEAISKRQCLFKPSEFEMDRCFEAEAYNRNSIEFCGFIAAVEKRDLCYMVFLPNWKDSSICENVVTVRDDCYFEAANGGIDARACSKISGSTYKALCNAVVAGDAAGCTGLARADDCYYHLAQKGVNATLCESIVNATLKEQCGSGLGG